MTTTLDRPGTAVPTPTGPTRSATPPPSRGRASRIVRGRPEDPRWARPALLSLLVATAVLYLWDLSASGTANSFYAAAVRSGSQSWKAWFFGSLDSANSITVDKPPASLWIMGLSARIFGFTSWSLLVPQALEGVAAVGLLYGAVRRISGHGAGLLAGAVLALTPAAVLMFRFDNPDALLTLLLVAGGYALTRAVETGSGRWLALCGSALGFAFLTKMLQGLLVLPVFAVVYLVAAPTPLRTRIVHTVLAGLSLLVSAGWWVLAVALWPASSRPYIGGSTDNTVLNLVFGYNGFGRLLGGDGNGGGGGGSQNSGFGGSTGLTRLFSSEFGNEISWLLPAALVALVAGLMITAHAPRTDRTRAALLVWGGWLVVTGAVFSFMQGTVHPYYSVALAPAIAALVAIGGTLLWRARTTILGRIGFAALVLSAGGWGVVLLDRTPSWLPWLRYVLVAVTVLAMIVALVPPGRLGRGARGLLVAVITAGLLGTASFGVATAAQPHTGSIPSVGPSSSSSSSGAGGGMGAGMGGGMRGGTGGRMGGGMGSTKGGPPSGVTSGPTGGGATSTAMGGAGSTTANSALSSALEKTTTTWAAATVGDQSAAELILSSGKAVIAIGGWSGSDDSPTLAQFEAYVAAGKITYFIAGSGNGGGSGGGSGVGAQITSWVEAHYSATTIGGTTVYELTS